MTESELRGKVVKTMQGWLGYDEKNGLFKGIIDIYNTQKPLPVGYKVKYTDEWCAATVSAAHVICGTTDIAPPECSCPRMIALYQKIGRWVEDDSYRPKPGDTIFYNWNDGPDYATTDTKTGANHVGMVVEVSGNQIIVIEGNNGEKVAYRTINVNGRYIRGYGIPDYASKADAKEDEEMTQEQFEAMAEKWLASRAAKSPSQWVSDTKVIERARESGISDGTRPQGLMSREEGMAMILAAIGQ